MKQDILLLGIKNHSLGRVVDTTSTFLYILLQVCHWRSIQNNKYITENSALGQRGNSWAAVKNHHCNAIAWKHWAKLKGEEKLQSNTCADNLLKPAFRTAYTGIPKFAFMPSLYEHSAAYLLSALPCHCIILKLEVWDFFFFCHIGFTRVCILDQSPQNWYSPAPTT